VQRLISSRRTTSAKSNTRYARRSTHTVSDFSDFGYISTTLALCSHATIRERHQTTTHQLGGACCPSQLLSQQPLSSPSVRRRPLTRHRAAGAATRPVQAIACLIHNRVVRSRPIPPPSARTVAGRLVSTPTQVVHATGMAVCSGTCSGRPITLASVSQELYEFAVEFCRPALGIA
jgi:hypothetical protein